jgi:DNA-binding NtrC family response regulator
MLPNSVQPGLKTRKVSAVSMAAPRIFIADDDHGICALLSKILRLQRYNVYYVQSVSEAREALGNRSFDVYLLDYHLQDGCGLSIAERLRAQGCQAPIILISGYVVEDLEIVSQTWNIFRFVRKPFSSQTICTVVTQALEESRLMRSRS